MGNDNPERRLAAIVAIDVVDYSRLMGADEEGTLERLKAHRDAMRPTVAEHGGRLVGQAGDGLLFEFPSVIEAVACTVKVQAAMRERNTDTPDEIKMQFRAGINVGDVMVDGDDIFGDGVNVAARIEQLAPPGGICISRSVRNQVRDKMEINLEDMGEIEVKNIVRPIRVFRVLKEGEVAAPPPKQTSPWQKYATVAAVVIALIVGGGGWWWSQQPDFEPADPNKYAFAIPEKPSIAVLPFDNLTGDPTLESLSDGLTENIIAVLAITPELFVIARNSSFAYKGKATKVQEIAEQLGVRYILEGSIQKDGDKLRVTAQLIDALNGRHLWAERYDEDMKGLFALQDRIAEKISDQMEVSLTVGKQAATWRDYYETPELFDVMMQGRVRFQTFSPQGNKDAERLWRRIRNEVKDKDVGNYLLTYIHLQKRWIGISDDYAKDLEIAKQYAVEILANNPDLASSHILMSWINRGEGKFDAAIKNIDDGLKILPGGGDENILGGSLKIFAGQPGEGVQLLQKGMRLEPDYPHYAIYNLATGYRLLGDFEKSKTISLGSLKNISDNVQVRRNAFANLASIAIFEGDEDQAKDYIKRLLTEYPTVTMSTFARFRGRYKDKASFDKWIAALRTAGLPENPPVKKADKPSIAVLPFANLSDDKDQEYFADGMTDDLITDLSKISGLDVIARNSVFTYKGKNVKVQEVARDLNVSHVLEGSVRRAGGKIRINAQLIDAATGAHLWAETFDRDYEDIFALQDEVASKIIQALKINLTVTETIKLAARSTDNIEAYELFLKGREAFFSFENAAMAKALDYYAQAVELDPTYADAYAAEAELVTNIWRFSLFNVINPVEARQRMETALARALKYDPDNSIALITQARILRTEGYSDEAISLLKKVIETEPNDATAYYELGVVLAFQNDVDAGMAYISRARRLDPSPNANILLLSGYVYLLDKEYEKALSIFKRGRKKTKNSVWGLSGLIAANGYLGDVNSAKAGLNEWYKAWPAYSQKYVETNIVFWSDAARAFFLEGLRKAGVPVWPHGYVGDEAQRLTTAEIEAEIIGQKTTGSTKTMGKYENNYKTPDRWTFESAYVNTGGALSVENDTLCQFTDGAPRNFKFCSPIYRNPNGTKEAQNEYEMPNNYEIYVFSIQD